MTSPRWRLGAAFVVLTTAAPLNAGCSFLLVDGPPPPEKRDYPFYCSRSMTYPILDGIAAPLSLLWLNRSLDRDDEPPGQRQLSRNNEAALSAGLTALFIASAAFGVHWVAQCRSAMDAQAQTRLR